MHWFCKNFAKACHVGLLRLVLLPPPLLIANYVTALAAIIARHHEYKDNKLNEQKGKTSSNHHKDKNVRKHSTTSRRAPKAIKPQVP